MLNPFIGHKSYNRPCSLTTSMSLSPISLLVFSLFVSSFRILAHGSNLNDDIEIQWGDGRGKISPDGKLLSLSLDKLSGSGFLSKNKYLFGRLDMEIKLIRGNSAGTVTTFYLSSQGPAMEPNHDELDFEFLGNLSGDPYTLHTNVFTNGKGDREMQFHLWFDPTKDFHTYSILWNPQHVIFLVDDIPIRDFKNHETIGVSFPNNQPMKLYSTLWNGEDWATRGGDVKTDWSEAPFIAYFRNFSADACVWSSDSGGSSCSSNILTPTVASQHAWFSQELDAKSYQKMLRVQKEYMIYNYCSDVRRFLSGIPKECTL